jgi:hypothetical protein
LGIGKSVTLRPFAAKKPSCCAMEKVAVRVKAP